MVPIFEGEFKGNTLHVITTDGEKQVLPIGYVFFKIESINSWTRYLEKLYQSIGDR